MHIATVFGTYCMCILPCVTGWISSKPDSRHFRDFLNIEISQTKSTHTLIWLILNTYTHFGVVWKYISLVKWIWVHVFKKCHKMDLSHFYACHIHVQIYISIFVWVIPSFSISQCVSTIKITITICKQLHRESHSHAGERIFNCESSRPMKIEYFKIINKCV